MSKRKPILVTALVLFWIGYLAIAVGQYFYLMSEVVQQDNLRRFRHIDYEMFLAGSLLAAGEVEALIENLDESSKTKEFDFYILKDGNEIISFHNPGYTQGQTSAQDFAVGTWMSKDDKVGWRTIKVRGYQLTIGIQPRGSEYILRVAADTKWGLVPDIIVVTLFFGLLIYFILKDILDLSRILQKRDRVMPTLISPRSKEAEVLMAVTSQYERMSSSLKMSNQTYSNSISPAILHELAENTKAPHAFEAVVVRVDVNGYTQMFLEKKDEFVTSTLNQYFKRASDMIQRYGGHIYQYIGDEIVFHFKFAQHKNCIAHAVSCVRSLFEVASDMNEELQAKGVPFVVKASLCSGKLRFIQLDAGYAFAGMPLIESVRMLGKIDEREHNILAIYADDFKQCSHLAEPFKMLSVAFKGFNRQSEIVEIKDFKPITGLLQELGSKTEYLEYLTIYRSDNDLAEILSALKAQLNHLSREVFVKIYAMLRGLHAERTTGRVAEAYSQLLLAITALDVFDSEHRDLRGLQLSSIIGLGPILLKAGVLNEQIQTALEKNLKHADPRVRGNTILALDELAPESYSFRQLFHSVENRAAADALLTEGRREYTRDIHNYLKGFLKSSNPFFIASGLYVMTYLHNYHKQRDSVYFAANSDLKEIPTLIARMNNASDPMVARRQVISLQQINSGKVA